MKLFELPVIVTLAGSAIDADNAESEVVLRPDNNDCGNGGGDDNGCSGGGGTSNSCRTGGNSIAIS